MSANYDFSKGVRGKYYRPDAIFRLPVYLDAKVQTYLAAQAQAKGVELSDLVNDVLKREIGIIEAVK